MLISLSFVAIEIGKRTDITFIVDMRPITGDGISEWWS